MLAGSPGASALADGGTMSASSAASGGVGAADRMNGVSAGGAGTGGGGSAESGLGSGGSATRSPPDELTQIGGRDELDTSQRYEPLIQTDKGNLKRVSPPRDANWLADRGGFGRLDQATDEPLYFKGETDGELFDIRDATSAGGVHGTGSAPNGTSGASNGADKDSIRGV